MYTKSSRLIHSPSAHQWLHQNVAVQNDDIQHLFINGSREGGESPLCSDGGSPGISQAPPGRVRLTSCWIWHMWAVLERGGRVLPEQGERFIDDLLIGQDVTGGQTPPGVSKHSCFISTFCHLRRSGLVARCQLPVTAGNRLSVKSLRNRPSSGCLSVLIWSQQSTRRISLIILHILEAADSETGIMQAASSGFHRLLKSLGGGYQLIWF